MSETGSLGSGLVQTNFVLATFISHWIVWHHVSRVGDCVGWVHSFTQGIIFLKRLSNGKIICTFNEEKILSVDWNLKEKKRKTWKKRRLLIPFDNDPTVKHKNEGDYSKFPVNCQILIFFSIIFKFDCLTQISLHLYIQCFVVCQMHDKETSKRHLPVTRILMNL